MKYILNKNNPLQLNALFIQPTRWCALNCNGCYCKKHAGGEQGFHVPATTLIDLFKAFYFQKNKKIQDNKHRCWANQITISIDDLPKNMKRRIHMQKIFNGVADLLSKDKITQSSYPEVHMTFNSFKTLESYMDCDILEELSLFKSLDMISFSNFSKESLKTIDKVKKTLGNSCYINYNHLIPNNVTSLNINNHLEKMIAIGKVVDHIYMVMFKTPVGDKRNELIKIGNSQRMSNDINYINMMMERLPKDVKRKITTDGCLQDTIKHSKTGFGCSSNVSRVQVWPDGSVTGCPYAFNSDGKEGRTLEDILANIQQTRGEYDFKEKCHLPQVYDLITRKQKINKS